jgi:kojibiose phosphorylase
VTGDDAFMARYGAEMILDTAVFWGCRAEWDPRAEHYAFTDVIGPDEYHEHVDNNFFTNYLAKWHLQVALDLMAWLRQHAPTKADELTERLGLTPEVCDHWQHIIDHLYIGRGPDGKVFEQFEGYFTRRDVDLATLEPRTRSVQALLGIKATMRPGSSSSLMSCCSLCCRTTLTRRRCAPAGTTTHRAPISPMGRR